VTACEAEGAIASSGRRCDVRGVAPARPVSRSA